MLGMNEQAHDGAVIKVIGVGGGGGNAVNYMARTNIEGVEFICANTDAQALTNVAAETVIQLGSNVTKGLGAGTHPEVGRLAAIEDRDQIMEALRGTDMVFITTGMGGGTGTGATPVIAEIAKEMGILTIAVVTRPFPFEGKRRMKLADEGIRALSETVDSLITIPNEKLLSILGKDASLVSAFAKADDVLCGAVRGISDIIKRPGLMNVDFADVKAVMSEMGMALMGTGCGSGINRAREATEAAIRNPLLENVNLRGARGILVNITAADLSLGEYSEVGEIIDEYASEDAIVKVGTVIDPNMRDELQVTVVATGLDLSTEHVKRPVHHAPDVVPHTHASERHHVDDRETQNRKPAATGGYHSTHRQPAPNRLNEQPVSTGHMQNGHSRHDVVNERAVSAPVTRNREPQRDQQTEDARHPNPRTKEGMEYLDIPAFLRR